MKDLTPQEIKKIKSAASIIEKGDVAVLEKLLEFEDAIEDNTEKLQEFVDNAAESISQKIGELEQKIQEKIDTVEDGEDYVLTDEDKQEIASKISVPVVEKIIEKTEVIKEQPIVTQQVTQEIKEVAVFDPNVLVEYGEKTRDGLELLKDDERLDVSAIKGLEEKLKVLEKRIDTMPRGGGGGGRSNNSTRFYPLTADGVTTVFNVPKSVASIVLCSDFPTVLMENNGFTINATRTQITLTTVNPPSAGSQLLYQYTSVFN